MLVRIGQVLAAAPATIFAVADVSVFNRVAEREGADVVEEGRDPKALMQHR